MISTDGELCDLLPISWITEIITKSAVSGQVSTAHRLLVVERDIQIFKFTEEISLSVENVLSNCNLFLEQVIIAAN